MSSLQDVKPCAIKCVIESHRVPLTIRRFVVATPFFPWAGGKRRLAKHIIPLFPKHTCYVEPFAGAGAIFFIKEPSKVEALNDINGELTNLYRVAQRHLEEFMRHFKWAIVSQEIFELMKRTDPSTLTDIERASRFYYLQKLTFGGLSGKNTYAGKTSGLPGLNLLRLEEDLSQAHVRLARVFIENRTWQECIRRYDRDHTLFYLDPPYLMPGVKGMYGHEFGAEQFEEMSATVRSIKGKAIISVNDSAETRRIFKGLQTKRVGITYMVNSKAGKGKGASELIVWNW